MKFPASSPAEMLFSLGWKILLKIFDMKYDGPAGHGGSRETGESTWSLKLNSDHHISRWTSPPLSPAQARQAKAEREILINILIINNPAGNILLSAGRRAGWLTAAASAATAGQSGQVRPVSSYSGWCWLPGPVISRLTAGTLQSSYLSPCKPVRCRHSYCQPHQHHRQHNLTDTQYSI